MHVLSKSGESHYFLKPRGFTLLELLVVVSILSAVAFIASGAFRGVSEQANDALVRVEMQEIAKAIRQFKQDTGYYPKTGPFALSVDGGEIEYADLPSYAGSTTVEKKRWFDSPANFYQLLLDRSPLDADNDDETIDHQLEYWNEETGRGWRGPYLGGYGEGHLYIGDEINDGLVDEFDDLVALEDGNTIADIVGIADPFEQRPVPVSAGNTDADPELGWKVWNENEERYETLLKWGSPYLLILPSISESDFPWLLSVGPNGLLDSTSYEDNQNDDVRLRIH
jgi:prepilin-type N-terminal cleavage/methylation domain-containing protein